MIPDENVQVRFVRYVASDHDVASLETGCEVLGWFDYGRVQTEPAAGAVHDARELLNHLTRRLFPRG